MLMQAMVVVDVLLVTPLGVEVISSLGIAGAITSFLLGIQFAIANGTQLLIARAYGSKDKIEIDLCMFSGWLFNLLFTGFIILLLFFFSEQLLESTLNHPVTVVLANEYIRVYFWVFAFSSLSQVLIAYFNGIGQTNIPLKGMLIELPLNVLFSWAFIYGVWFLPELGMTGAAVGSVLSILMRLVFLSWKFIASNRSSFENFRFNTRIGHHFKEVYPVSANFLILAGGAFLYQIAFSQLSIYAFAAITLVLPWMKIVGQVANAWSQATAINISQMLGSHQKKILSDFVHSSLSVVLFISIFLSILLYIFSILATYLYSDLDSLVLGSLSSMALIMCLIPLIRCYNTLCGHTLRSFQASEYVLIIHAITQWFICIPLCFLLVYLEMPVRVVFGVMLFEEILKLPFFRFKLLAVLR